MRILKTINHQKEELTGKKFVVAALVLLLTFSAFMAGVTLVNAADIPTFAFLTVNPNPVGVNQRVGVAFWLDKVTPTAATAFGDRWSNLMLTITKPDGTTETRGPFTQDAVGSGYTTYVPSTVGKYIFKISFPGQIVNISKTVSNNYLPSQSLGVELTVQQAQLQYWADYALPAGYWARPLNGEFRNVNSIASYWLAAGATGPHGPRAYDSLGNYQPYGTAPDTAHVIWTKEVAFGGSVGGEFGDNVFYPGETYERKFQPPIIMNGRLYYNLRLGSSQWDGAYCVDLATGETIWYINSTNKAFQTFTFGQLLDFQSPNQHGVIPYLWSVQGSTYKMYDPFSGDWILDIAGVPSGSMVLGNKGEILIYTLNAAGNYMTLWNSTKAINPNIDTNWSWRPTSAAGTSSSVNVTAGYEWNVTIPDVPGSQSITKISKEVIYARSTIQSSPTAIMTDVAYDIKDGKQPVQLWMVQNRTYSGTIMNGPMNEDVFTTFVKETMVWYGYSVLTGSQIWGPTQPYTNAWGMYQPYADSQAGAGKLVVGGYDGTVHCFNIKTGENLWNYNTGNSGFETPYGSYPFKDNAITIADGKVYAATNEHSPNTPFYHGWRLHTIDLATGQPVWNISFIGLAPIIADGRAVTVNYFDNRIYCFATGTRATTVAASPKIAAQGSSVLIEGTVTDQSPGQTSLGIPAAGTPAVSDESMTSWMEYLWMQLPKPTNVKGVSVRLTAIDPNGNFQDIGTAVTDDLGNYAITWNPPVPGLYTVRAKFDGSHSYYSSQAGTSFAVAKAAAAQPAETSIPTQTTAPTIVPAQTPAPNSPSPSIAQQPTSGAPTTTYVAIGALVIIVVVAVAALILRRRR